MGACGCSVWTKKVKALIKFFIVGWSGKKW